MCVHGGMTNCTEKVSSSDSRCSGVLGLDLSLKNDKKYVSAVPATLCVTFGHSSPNDISYLESQNPLRLHSLEVTSLPVLSCPGRGNVSPQPDKGLVFPHSVVSATQPCADLERKARERVTGVRSGLF